MHRSENHVEDFLSGNVLNYVHSNNLQCLLLFLLHTEPIYRIGNPQGRFGYADNTAILSIGDTVEETCAMVSSSVDEMVRWGAANGVSLDPKKTEVLHFSSSKLKIAPAVRHGEVEKHPESALRWLGIWLDSRLSFRIHVKKWAANTCED
jgi:hypothetical protein